MIPVKLELSGFLSYYRPVTLDFTSFDLACISGPNGAGKSSLLDAITWALFGKARRSDEGIIHIHSDSALVDFVFEYEGALYRVVRTKHRQRPTRLEFQIQVGGQWRPLTENTLRATQEKIESLLHMNYETFVQASFFLQGKADRFAQQTPAKRKEVLAQILGLEVWDAYLERAREERRQLTVRREELTRELARLETELEQTAKWQAQLETTENTLEQVQQDLEQAEALLQQWQQREAEIKAQREAVEQLRRAWQEAQQQWEQVERTFKEREAEQRALQQRLAEEENLREAQRRWEEARKALAHWEALAEQARVWQQKRRDLEAQLAQERVALETRLQALEERRRRVHEREEALARLYQERESWKKRFEDLQARWAPLQQVETALAQCREEMERVLKELQRVRTLKETVAVRRQTLEKGEEGSCPVCAQPLPQHHRENLLRHLDEEMASLETKEASLEARLGQLQAQQRDLEGKRREAQELNLQIERLKAQRQALEERIRQAEDEVRAWKEEAEPEWRALQESLENESFATDVRKALREIEARLKELGYDEQAHRQAKEAEAEGARLQEALRALEQARARLDTVTRELARLKEERERWKTRAQERERAYREAAARLESLQRDVPDLTRLRERILHLRERAARLQEERGALRQRLALMDRYRQEAHEIRQTLEQLNRTLSHYHSLEEAFGRNGVPALLIEQALPQLEEEANRLLEQLTDGEMRITFRTQRALRSREGIRETLDILVSDRYGERDYETFSGGEAFRINFAIRLALARFLARRAGARLQFLVIDEGFGSQDQMGRQRLVEAIQAVRSEFAKILVITHLEDLKERFPVRIEVEKGPEGSRLQVLTG